MRIDLDKKKLAKGILICFFMIVIPLLLGFLLSYFLKRNSLFETITCLFSLAYLFLLLIQLKRKDNLVYRKNKYKNKEEYRESVDHVRYVHNQTILSVAALTLVLSSLLIFFFYK